MGEREIIETIQKRLTPMPKMPVPFGDDVAACSLDDDNVAVLKTDMLVDKTDVPQGMSLWQAARKAVVMNISDFAAKGVKPLAMLVSLGLPRNLTRSNIEAIGDGLNAGAQEYDSYVIGGDTGESSDLIISLSVFGTARRKCIMLRSETKPGDIVAVTGSFGKPTSGLKLLSEKLNAPKEIREALIDSVFMPHARLKEGLALGQSGAVTASIDSSDGLAWSLHEIARASRVGFVIDKLPKAEETVKLAEAHGLDLLELTLYGGEEYELVVTVKPNLLNGAMKAVEEVGGRLLPVGKATSEKRIVLNIEGRQSVIEPRGWEHFKSS